MPILGRAGGVAGPAEGAFGAVGAVELGEGGAGGALAGPRDPSARSCVFPTVIVDPSGISPEVALVPSTSIAGELRTHSYDRREPSQESVK